MNCVAISEAKIFIFDSDVATNVETIKDQLIAANIRLFCFYFKQRRLGVIPLVRNDVRAGYLQPG